MKNLNLNNIKNLQSLKESLNGVIDEKIQQAEVKKFTSKLKNMGFNELNCIFESSLTKLYDTQNGKKIIGAYVNTVRNNNALKEAYIVSKTISDYNNIDDKEIFVNQIALVSEKIDKDNIKTAKNEIAEVITNVIKECKLNKEYLENVVNSYNESILKPIDFILENNRTSNNVNAFSNSLNKIVSLVKEDKNTEETVTTEYNTDNLNELFENEYTEWENKVIKDLALVELSNSSKEGLFEDYKKACLLVLNEMCEDENLVAKNNMLSLKEKLEQKSYNEKTLNEDLFKMSELKYTLEN